MEGEKDDYTIKVVLLGESGVGKTCILVRYDSDFFDQYSEPTQCASFTSKTVRSKNGRAEVRLHIWDTAGQEVYHSLTPAYYRDADAIILVYDITKPASFEALTFWMGEIHHHAPKECLITIAGNKCDRIDNEKVDPSEAKNLANRENASYFSVSAKENINISEMFLDIIVRKYASLSKEFAGGEGVRPSPTASPENLKKKMDKIKLKPCCDEDATKRRKGKCDC